MAFSKVSLLTLCWSNVGSLLGEGTVVLNQMLAETAAGEASMLNSLKWVHWLDPGPCIHVTG